MQAARLLGAAHAFYARQGRLSWEDSALDSILPGWEAGPERAVIGRAYEQGRVMKVGQVVDFALNRL